MAAEAMPAKTAVVSDGEKVTYRGLVDMIDRVGAGLQKAGLRPGAVISTDLPVGPEFYALALAAMEYGYGLFPVPLNMVVAPDDQALASLAFHVTNAPEGGAQSRFEDLASHGEGTTVAPAGSAGYIVYASSGTTGMQRVASKRPRRHPYRGVLCSGKYGAGIGFGPHLTTNPSYHRGTLGPALHSLQAGSGVAIMKQWSPESFVEHVDLYRADSTFLMSGKIRSVLECGAKPRHQLRSLQHGAVACPVAVKFRAIEHFGPVLLEHYATADMMISEIDTAAWRRHPGSVGRAMPGVRIRVAAKDGALAGPLVNGEILVRPGLAERSGEGYVRTGDAGYFDESGHLYVIGRIAEGGATEYALAERRIRELPDVAGVAVIDTEHAVICRIERSGPAANETELRSAVEDAIGGAWQKPTRIDIRVAGAFNRTESGKLSRIAD